MLEYACDHEIGIPQEGGAGSHLSSGKGGRGRSQFPDMIKRESGKSLPHVGTASQHLWNGRGPFRRKKKDARLWYVKLKIYNDAKKEGELNRFLLLWGAWEACPGVRIKKSHHPATAHRGDPPSYKTQFSHERMPPAPSTMGRTGGKLTLSQKKENSR